MKRKDLSRKEILILFLSFIIVTTLGSTLFYLLCHEFRIAPFAAGASAGVVAQIYGKKKSETAKS